MASASADEEEDENDDGVNFGIGVLPFVTRGCLASGCSRDGFFELEEDAEMGFVRAIGQNRGGKL